MKLREKQSAFTKAVIDLISYGHSLGYEFTFGDCFRDSRCDYGHKKSTHRVRLAVDLNLFIDDKWINEGDHPAWKKLHTYFEELGGSKMIKEDANHFSFKHDGVR